MNAKILLQKERVQRMLALIKTQENIEECYDFDQDYVKAKEAEMLEEYAAEFAALNQLVHGQIVQHQSNARQLGTIVINSNGKAETIN